MSAPSSDRKRKATELEVPDVGAGGAIKAVVTEQNGEISCSVEETNRIRALLGLKPLKLDKSKSEEQVAVDNFRNKMESEKREAEEALIRERLEIAKNKRLQQETLGSNTLGTLSANESSDGTFSAANWVQRSREIEKTNKEKEKARLAAKRLEEEEAARVAAAAYSARDLKGLQVLHDSTDFDMGQDVILTLADSNILETDDNGRFKGRLNDKGQDVLENVNLADRDRRLQREKQQKRLKQPIYAGYDDHEFTEAGEPVKAKKLLSQYDVEDKAGPKLTLSGEASMELDESNDKAVLNESKERESQSLNGSNGGASSAVMQDFYTPTEYATFKKKDKDGAVKEKKKRKIRKKTGDDEEGGEGEGSMIALLEAEAARKDDPDNEHGSRGGGHSVVQQRSRVEAADRQAGYDLAVQQAALKVSSHHAFKSGVGAKLAEVEDDADLQLAVASSRRLALLQQQQQQQQDVDYGAEFAKTLANRATQLVHQSVGTSSSNSSSSAMDTDHTGGAHIFVSDRTKQLLAAELEHEQQQQQNEGDELKFDEIDSEGRRADGSLVFTTTTEFTTRLQARLNERARAKAEAAVKAAALAAQQAAAETAAGEGSGPKRSMFADWEGNKAMSVDGEGGGEEGTATSSELGAEDADALMDVDSDDEEGMIAALNKHKAETDHQLDFVQNQPLASRGMAATLALLKGSGDLKQKDQLAGRAKDTRNINPSSTDFKVKLEYRDENGRLLTVKEAFRQLCYRFHGYGPSRKKKEKRLQAEALRSKAASSKVGADMGTMKSMVRAQEATGKAHVVVQGGGSGISAAELMKKSGAKVPAAGSGSVIRR